MTESFPSSSTASSSSASSNGHPGNGTSRRSLGLLESARLRKESFLQLFVMTGIFMLSLRSVGQKYRAQELEHLNSDLREERDSLSVRMDSVKSALLSEAALDPSGLLSSHLHRLFQDPSSSDRRSS